MGGGLWSRGFGKVVFYFVFVMRCIIFWGRCFFVCILGLVGRGVSVWGDISYLGFF